MTTEFATVLAALATRLSSAQIRAWCTLLTHAPGPSGALEAKLAGTQAGHGVTGAAHQLISAWSAHAPHLAGSAVALALASVDVAQGETEARRPRLVVSGPLSPAVAVRMTSSVVLEVIRAASRRVLVVSFAAHGVDEVVRELMLAADRSVRLDLVLETTIEEGGTLRGRGAAAAFAGLARRAHFWHWPAGNRRGNVSLHAKIVVADGAVALMSSANLTDRGLSDNIEVGVLMADESFAGRLDAHFRSLMRPEARCLTLVTPRGSTREDKPG